MLDEHWSVESLTPGVERWLAELPDGEYRNSSEAGVKEPPRAL
jgi:hypothetical protein